MALQYGLKQPLRIYENLEHQNRFRQGGDAKIFNLLCPVNYLLPFQIKRSAGVSDITSIALVNVATGASEEILNSIPASDLSKVAFDSYDYLIYFGQEELSSNIAEGEHYLVIKDVENTWYSEVITFLDFPADVSTGCGVTKITYWETCDVADIFYRTMEYLGKQYKNIIYLDIDIGKPNYNYEEEGDEDGLGNFSPEYKRLGKQYFLQGVFPEFMVDALTLLPMHISESGEVQVLTHRGYTGALTEISVSPEWQDDLGLIALTDILFITEYNLKVNCCDAYDLPYQACLRTYTGFVAKLSLNSNDYNNFEYTSALNGSKIALEDNDLVMVDDNGDLELFTYNSNSYSAAVLAILDGDVFADLNQLNGLGLNPTIYYFFDGGDFLTDPVITSNTALPNGDNFIAGNTYANSVIEIWTTNQTVNIKVATISAQDFVNGYQYTKPSGHTHVWVEAHGITCELGASDQEIISTDVPTNYAVGSAVIEDTLVVG